jgi:hypothetical protein
MSGWDADQLTRQRPYEGRSSNPFRIAKAIDDEQVSG